MTETLLYTPIRDGYTLEPGNSCLEVRLDGAVSHKRNDILYHPHKATVNWVLNSIDYTRFMGFFRTNLKNATQPFLLDLVTDIGALTTHKCRTFDGMPKLTNKKGLSYFVTCTLEIQANPTYTGTITYQEPNQIIFAVFFPYLAGPILAGDTVRILSSTGTHPTGPTALNLDGVYEVSATVGFNTLELTSPSAVNSGWTTLATLGAPGQYGDETHGNVISTVTRVPT